MLLKFSCDASGTWASWPTGALLRSLLTHLSMHAYLVTSSHACLPRPSSHPYINPDSTCTSCWSFLAYSLLCVLVLLLFRLRAFVRATQRETTIRVLSTRAAATRLPGRFFTEDIGQVSHSVHASQWHLLLKFGV